MNKTVKILCPIDGFLNIDNIPVELDKDLTIRRIKKNEEDKIKEIINWNLYGRTTCPYFYILDIEYTSDQSKPIEIYARKIETCFRVFFENDINIVALISPDKSYLFNPTISSIPTDKNRTNENSSINLKIFWLKFKSAYEKKPVALDYFSKSQLRSANNDKIIDWSISLESLFVPEKERNGKKVFILQGLKILGFNEEDIKRIDDLMEIRNAIVHANLKKQQTLFKTLVWFEKCTTLMRKILSLYVDKQW